MSDAFFVGYSTDLPSGLEKHNKTNNSSELYSEMWRVATSAPGEWCEFRMPDAHTGSHDAKVSFVDKVRVRMRQKIGETGDRRRFRSSVRGDYGANRFFFQLLPTGGGDR